MLNKFREKNEQLKKSQEHAKELEKVNATMAEIYVENLDRPSKDVKNLEKDSNKLSRYRYALQQISKADIECNGCLSDCEHTVCSYHEVQKLYEIACQALSNDERKD